MKRIGFAIIAALFAAVPAYADDARHKDKSGAAGANARSAEMSDGEVRRVDKDAKKITLRHGPLANLDMPAMTMVFQVKDPAVLDQVKVGDRVKFIAEKTGSTFTITKIERAK